MLKQIQAGLLAVAVAGCSLGTTSKQAPNAPPPPRDPIIRASGLMITGDPDMQWSWASAYNHCIKLKLAGYDDWRLPTLKEMKDINKSTTGGCAPTGIKYPMVTFGCLEYWASDDNGSIAYSYGFDDEDVSSQGKGYTNLFLCVRAE